MIEADDFLSGMKKGDRRVELIVPISGGKDSQACLKMAVRDGYQGRVVGLFCDTGFEHPWTYQHAERMSEMYDVPVVRVSEVTVDSEVVRNGRFPDRVNRFCTSTLKLKASRKFYVAMGKVGVEDFQVWLGVRADESKGRKQKYHGIEDWELFRLEDIMPGAYPKWLGDVGVRVRLPIVDWGVSDVMMFLEGEENPLYRFGFARVGCFPCLAGRRSEWEACFSFDEFGRQQKVLVEELAEIVDDSEWFGGSGGECWVCSI